MKVEKLIIGKYVEDQQKRLFELAEAAIENKTKLHVSAPVGTGKTWFAIELIKKYQKDYQFIILEPLISISSQVEKKLSKSNITVFEFNSETRNNLDEFKIEHQEKYDEKIAKEKEYFDHFSKDDSDTFEAEEISKINFVSTFDSCYRLIEENEIDINKTILIIDESHAFIQDARETFDKNVRILLNHNIPIIGLSGTASQWVLKSLFEFDHNVDITASEYPIKIIKHTKTSRIAKVIAIQINKMKNQVKVIIWTHEIKEQEKIKEAIEILNPNLKVVILNRSTKINEASELWNSIIDNEVIPDDIDVAIINKVGQMGINIINTDIKLQYLVGKFDPISFLQYVGRCRNYDDVFIYFYNDFGDDEYINEKYEESNGTGYLDFIEKEITKKKNITYKRKSEIPAESAEYYYHMEDIGIVLNRCSYAKFLYEKFRKIGPKLLLEVIEELDDSKTVRFEKYDYFDDEVYQEMIDDNNRDQWWKSFKVELPKSIIKSYREILRIASFYNSSMKNTEVTELINESVDNTKDAKSDNKLFVPKTKVEALKKATKSFSRAKLGTSRMIVTASLYDIYKDEEMIKSLIISEEVDGNTIASFMKALVFYQKTYVEHKRFINRVLKKFKGEIGNCKSATEWKNDIDAYLKSIVPAITDPLSPDKKSKYGERVTDGIEVEVYQKMFRTVKDKHKDASTGKTVNKQKLKDFSTTYKDYVVNNKSDIIKRIS